MAISKERKKYIRGMVWERIAIDCDHAVANGNHYIDMTDDEWREFVRIITDIARNAFAKGVRYQKGCSDQ